MPHLSQVICYEDQVAFWIYAILKTPYIEIDSFQQGLESVQKLESNSQNLLDLFERAYKHRLLVTKPIDDFM